MFDALTEFVGSNGVNAAAQRFEGGERGRQGRVVLGIASAGDFGGEYRR